MRSVLLLGSLLCALAGCGGAPPPVEDPPESLEARIERALRAIDEDPGGEHQIFEAGPAWVDPAFAGREGILVIDEVAVWTDLLRHRNRLLGFLSVEPDGRIVEVPLQWSLPRVFGEVVTSFASTPVIPSAALARVGERLAERYGDEIPPLGTHGLAVFGVLVDRVPESPILLFDLRSLYFNYAVPEAFCARDLAALRAHAERTADALRSILVAHNIRFINASFGHTIETVRHGWRRVCGGDDPPREALLELLAAYAPIMDVLFASEGVFTAHAALASPVAEDYPYDQPDLRFPNRLRVGGYSHAGEEVPPRGLDAIPPGWLPNPADPADADVFVNGGCGADTRCRAERPLTITGRFGMGEAPFPVAASSFVTPVLLATAVAFRAGDPRPMSNALVADLKAGLVTARYLDPLLHGR